MNLDELAQRVLDKLAGELPRALLIGALPEIDNNYIYVNQKPYEAVVIGILPPGELLRMPSDAVCEALLEDMPVYFWQNQPWHKAKGARLLCRELAAAEQHLKQLGVRPMSTGGIITAQEAKRLKTLGRMPPAGSRLTPLARDILEGKAP